MKSFEVLWSDKDFLVIDKPAGFFVHRPEDPHRRRFCAPEQVILSQLRRQVGKKLYPVHRLDVATSGLLVFALHSAAANFFSKSLQERAVRKRYLAVCRGWLDEEGLISLPLPSDSSGALLPAETRFRRRAQWEVPSHGKVGRHSTVRFSLTEVEPLTGRFHQIRRHFNRISHPVIGDNDHGDSKQNRFFREQLGVAGLCLRAVGLNFPSLKGDRISLTAPETPMWSKISELAGVSYG